MFNELEKYRQCIRVEAGQVSFVFCMNVTYPKNNMSVAVEKRSSLAHVQRRYLCSAADRECECHREHLANVL